ncbi:Ribosomal protein S6 (RpsF) (PDB:4V4H) [Commensalibacter communis]|uniref:Small ribosomal subunit protein bS6 n=1 Tax=Commensalibacter communis TaxID=2972786 RepID=A0A9W4TP75_9PROT|nr:30S ribosomal protein S6 [Commensalibacter communis]CAI3924203.1 Ribosomal protein S6 (RpsF) (PDB:4V4H) [Commensalibacter communis]CAI3925676.1 Ribosomal protein S6 (RpsF) (PDB:4V4H) [Commensalibacter communis]CAI3929030.1 Ribosomal protein S6 (RpsF) (PDB:4V4H) [Commensalibacter communis]CAI3936764.1 Ribosomal protein S6 (RpsF) (PDB:4V4H) [Commensalibacter communis]CAI3937313.1 Ribosomal protein S6 (RpsF) (PDB:4V4H) [Commensalibacter communis]
MPLYECVFIARNDVTQQQVEDIANGVASLIESEEGSVQKREYWGLRNLAYRVKKNRKGHYMLLGVDAKSTTIKEIERQLNLNEDVLRFMTLRIDAIDEAPSAILSRKGDDSRDRSDRSSNNRSSKSSGRYESGRKAVEEDDLSSDNNSFAVDHADDEEEV